MLLVILDDVIAASQTQSNPFSNRSNHSNSYSNNNIKQQQFGQPNSAFAQVSSLNHHRQNVFAQQDDSSNVFNKQSDTNYLQTQLNDFSNRYQSSLDHSSFKYNNRKDKESLINDPKDSHYDNGAIHIMNRQDKQVGRFL